MNGVKEKGLVAMADVFISFATKDAARVQPFVDGCREAGLTVFWSNDIPPGAADYQRIIRHEIRAAPVTVVVWTATSGMSDAVAREVAEAKLIGSLLQAQIDDLRPLDGHFESPFKAQLTMLLGRTGSRLNGEWLKLFAEVQRRVVASRGASVAPAAPPSPKTPVGAAAASGLVVVSVVRQKLPDTMRPS